MRMFILIALFVGSSALNVFALSASVDMRGRTTLTTSISGTLTWSKEGEPGSGFVSLGNHVSPFKDQRPNKHYVKVDDVWTSSTADATHSFNFTGVEVGILLDKPLSSTIGANNYEVYLDGVLQTPDPVVDDMRSDYSQITDQIQWGAAGLTNTSHTVQIKHKTGTTYFKGYWYSDFNYNFNRPMTYKVTNGTTTETVTVTPSVNRKAVINGWADQIVAKVPFQTSDYGWAEGGPIEYMGALATLYTITKRADVQAAAASVLAYYQSHKDGNGLIPATWQVVNNGRTGYNYVSAYQAFKDDYPAFAADCLAEADATVGFFINSWAEHPTLHIVGKNPADTDPGSYPSNWQTSPALSAAACYYEPSSAWYQNSDCLTFINNNSYGFQNIDPSTGVMWESGVYTTPAERASLIYGSFEFTHLKYISDKSGVLAALANTAAGWLNGWGQTEPYWFEDTDYFNVSPETLAWRLLPLAHAGVTIDSAFADLMYSAATASGNYVPSGSDDATLTLDQLLRTATPLWTGQELIRNNIPVGLWAYQDGRKKYNGTLAASRKKYNGTVLSEPIKK